jgi:hypothetical protein
VTRGSGFIAGARRVVGRARRRQPAEDEIGHEIGDLLRGLRAFGPEPVRRPVQRAEERAGGDGRIGGPELAATDPVRHECAHAAFVAIPFGDDALAQTRGERIDFEMRRRSLHLVEQTENVAGGQRPQPCGERGVAAARLAECGEQPIERAVLAEEEQFVLAVEVMIEVAGRQVGGRGDVAHAGGGEPVRPEHPGGGAEDADAPGVGAQ